MQMADKGVFAIFGAQNAAEAAAIDERVIKSFTTRQQIASGQWIVVHASPLTAEVYKVIEANGGQMRCIILPMERYFGWHSQAIWDFVSLHNRPQ